ncbi:MAG: type II toxin-antitoxin system RelE/ParE family toxin [Oscillospiraceae bacterium]|nr:type II toxin-antitoxin system RelE/ParE family toxin [Oscillospiraceae bacterium]
MEQYEVRMTEKAYDSLRDIARHIAYNLMSPQAAVKTINYIRNELSKLDSMPSRIPLVNEEPWRSEGIHKMIIKKYIAYFTINENQNIVNVLYVAYGRKDQKNILRDISD